MSDASICHYRLSRVEYDRAVEAGVFEPAARVELIDGDLHAITPQGSRHATGVELVTDSLRGAFGAGFRVRCRMPEYWILALPDTRLEVYREPGDDGYRSVTIHGTGDSITPKARPEAQIVVDDLLP